MQLFSADAMVFSKKNLEFFLTPKTLKNGPQKLLITGPDHSPESTFRIMKSPD